MYVMNVMTYTGVSIQLQAILFIVIILLKLSLFNSNIVLGIIVLHYGTWRVYIRTNLM